MILYKNIIPNTDKSRNFVGTKIAFKSYLDASFKCYEVSTKQQTYNLSNQITLTRTPELERVLEEVTYGYDNINGIDYFFHIADRVIYQEYIVLYIERDDWAMDVMEHTDQVKNLQVIRTNKNIGVGVYKNIALTEHEPKYEDLAQPTNNLSIVFNGLYEIRTDEAGSKYYTKTLAMFHIPFSELKQKQTALGDNSPIIDFAIKYISGITDYRQTVDGHPLWSSIQVLKAYICETSMIIPQNDTLFVRSFIKDTSQTMNIHFISCGTKEKSFLINIDPRFEYYVGTKYANLKLIRTTFATNVSFRFLTVQDGLEIKILQGDRELDITKGFEINLTANEGMLTTQQKTNAALQGIGGVLSLGIGFASGNTVQAIQGVQSAANTFNGIINHNSNASYTKGGDGYSTFRNTDGTIANPFVIVKYYSADNEPFNAVIEGANFNKTIYDLKELLNMPNLPEYDAIPDEEKPPFIVQAHVNLVEYFPLKTQQMIISRFNTGCYLQKL